MRDMENIFYKSFGGDLGFFNVPKPMESVSSLPFSNEMMKIVSKNNILSKLIISDETLKNEIKNLLTGFDYFPGGESEAISRLTKKISTNPDYVNNFSKPSTVSTNEKHNPLEPSTTGLSPYLSTGCLSPRLIWQECIDANKTGEHTKPPVSLIGQLMFREMFHLLSRSVDNWDSDINNSNCKNIDWDKDDEEKILIW